MIDSKWVPPNSHVTSGIVARTAAFLFSVMAVGIGMSYAASHVG